MSGLYPGFPQRSVFTGNEIMPMDTENAQGINPETATVSLLALAAAVSFLSNSTSETTVAGSRYFSSYAVGSSSTFTGIRSGSGKYR